MTNQVIDIAHDFSRFPGGRVRADGPHSGEQFLEDLLKPAVERALKAHSLVVIKIDGVAGLPSSFLDEAFGGLIRQGIVNLSEAQSLIVIEAATARVRMYPEIIKTYMTEAANQRH